MLQSLSKLLISEFGAIEKKEKGVSGILKGTEAVDGETRQYNKQRI